MSDKMDFKAALEEYIDNISLDIDGVTASSLHSGTHKAILTALRLADRLQSGEVSHKVSWVGVDKYEEMMGGQRLPDGNGYDQEVTAGMFKAMVEKMIEECE